MNKHWDYDVPTVEFWKECLRVLKPGGHLLSFFGTRTYHRGVVRIEDAGFEIRDMISWIYGSGFPKSLDISKAIDKRNGTTANTSQEFAEHIKRKRLELNIGLTKADEFVCGGTTNYSWFEGRPAGQRLPRLSEYQKIKELLNLDNRFDEFMGEAEREVIGKAQAGFLEKNNTFELNNEGYGNYDITLPATSDAIKWNGWGSALKPACEPICVARKPVEGTIAENVLKYGTGGINIDGGRIGNGDDKIRGGCINRKEKPESAVQWGMGTQEIKNRCYSQGRFPANIIFDESAAELLDEMSGELKSGDLKGNMAGLGDGNKYGKSKLRECWNKGDSGGASRFFYCAKASKAERNGGLEGFEHEIHSDRNAVENIGANNPRNRTGTAKQNHHPTVKPLKLMQYLVRLITPSDGICLDPFAGSGTTLMACVKEGFNYIGIEREKEYCDIAEARVKWIKEQTEKQKLDEPELFT